MIHEKICLSEDRKLFMKSYLHEESAQKDFQIKKRPAIIILPGGAFYFLSDTEAEPVA